MIDLATIFSKNSFFDNLEIDRILVEGPYPVMFTMKRDEKEFLVICPVINSKEIVWILSEITLTNIICMLKDNITIYEAFMGGTSTKYIARYDGNNVLVEKNAKEEIPEYLLPDQDEYMEVDEGEFDEEIQYYEKIRSYKIIEIHPRRWRLYKLQKKHFSILDKHDVLGIRQYRIIS